MSAVKVSSPDKMMFEDAGITKAGLVAHYESVAPRMLGFMAGRPLTLQRFPNGISSNGFMQKNAADHFPDSIRRFEVPRQGGGVTVYPVVDQADDVAYLANQNTVTFHMWTSSMDRPMHPDWMVLDLDPDDGDLDGVRFATAAIHEVLTEFGVDGFCLATGSSGFHVWVALDGSMTGDEVSLASRAVAGIAAARHPERMTTEFLKRERKGRVFVDWLRNGPTATVVVPFSLRPKPQAPVAVPLTWDELAEARPDGWTIGRLVDRLQVETNPRRQALSVDAIVEAARSAGVDLDSQFDRFGRK
ncbi:MAG: non-homologous end-joining DNA ligase [Acidimicrobiia bacterium]